MARFYVCDFCPEDEKKLLKHSPEAKTKVIVHNEAAVCQSCIREMCEILDEEKTDA